MIIFLPVLCLCVLVFTVISYITCAEVRPFKRDYNNHFLHIPILIFSIFAFIGSMNYFSITATKMWVDYRGNVGIIRRTLNDIENINCYSFTKVEVTNSGCVFNFTDKRTGDKHNIWVHDGPSTYMHWYKNGQLVIRNGTRNGEDFPGLDESMWVCHSLNIKIFNKLKGIAEKIKRDNICKQLGNPDLLNSAPIETKTMEITAPTTTTITGTVTEQGQIIHTETL